MQRLFRDIGLLLVIILAYSCKKNIEAGIKTNISGTTYDDNSQQPIPNVPIYINEYTTGFYGPIFRATIDSTKSGSDGNFNISFSTTGHGSEYRIVFQPGDDFLTFQNGIILNVGKDTMIRFSAIKFHVLKARFQITQNPNPPLRVSTVVGLQASVWGTNNDTTVFMKILPNLVNEIQFTITNVDSPSIYNIQLDTINFSGFQDTFNMVFPLVPENFPIRR